MSIWVLNSSKIGIKIGKKIGGNKTDNFSEKSSKYVIWNLGFSDKELWKITTERSVGLSLHKQINLPEWWWAATTVMFLVK